MEGFQIWDSHVHLFPPEIYNNWDHYAPMDETFANLTRKPADGKGTEEAWVNIEEALACADEAAPFCPRTAPPPGVCAQADRRALLEVALAP